METTNVMGQTDVCVIGNLNQMPKLNAKKRKLKTEHHPNAFNRKEIGYSFHKIEKFSIATSIAYRRRG